MLYVPLGDSQYKWYSKSQGSPAVKKKKMYFTLFDPVFLKLS